MPLKPLEITVGLLLSGILVTLISVAAHMPPNLNSPSSSQEQATLPAPNSSTLDKARASILETNSLPKLSLRVTVPEPVLRGGKLEREYLNRSFDLESEGVQLARENKSLEPLKSELERIYSQLEARTPQNARFKKEGKEWVARGQTGWTVNRASTEKRLLEALENQTTRVSVDLNLTAPQRSARGLLEAKVFAHLASGQSSFLGSPDFRVHNIRVGSSKLDGLWLEQGQDFNFNQFIGRISQARGFLPGYVISGTNLTLEDGGGICQVSTTVFRAAYGAGLRILERHAHSHAVAYYDPTGFEATVYAPNLNLRFRNDTSGPLLIQASWDLKDQTLNFDLFGNTPDRTVTVSSPVISKRIPARPPGFMPDPKLELGKAERIDMPASGMNVKIARRIEYASGKVKWDETRSVYRSWGGVFAVHPKDPRLNE
ncbi:MAG: VanW family protein [Pseudopedobacter sp.]|nr:VanW family protein [Deinococcales bacterium]